MCEVDEVFGALVILVNSLSTTFERTHEKDFPRYIDIDGLADFGKVVPWWP